jgi:TolB protein
VGFVIGVFGIIYHLGGSVEHGNVTFDVSPDGKNIVFSDAEGDLYLIHLSTQLVERLTNTEDVESSPAFSPDGESIVYSALSRNGNGSCLFIRTLDGKTVRRITSDDGVSDTKPSYSSDGDLITFVRAHRHRP